MDAKKRNWPGRVGDKAIEIVLPILAFIIAILVASALLVWFLTLLGNEVIRETDKQAARETYKQNISQGNNQATDFLIGMPFTFAQVASIFGVLGLVAGFSSHGKKSFRKNMRWVAVWYVLSALGLSLIGMFLPYIAFTDATGPHTENVQTFLTGISWIIVVSFFVVALLFAIGTFLLVKSIPEIINAEQTSP